VAAVVAVSVVGITKVVPSFVLEEGMPHSSLPRLGYERIKATFGTFRLANIIIDREDSGSLLEPAPLQTIDLLQKRMAAIPEVRVLPSIVDVFKQFNLVVQGKAELPSNQDTIDQSMLLVGKSKLSRLIDRSGHHALLTISIKATDPRRMAAVIHEIQDQLRNAPKGYFAQLSGTPVLVESINHYIVENKIISIISCLVIVLVLCMIVNSSVSLGLISMASAAVSALAIFGLMGFAHIYLDLSSATITTIAIGVGVDAAVHYLLQFRADLSEHAHRLDQSDLNQKISWQTYQTATQTTTRRYGKTIVFDSLSNILGFVPLLFSSFPILKIAGFLLVVNQLMVVVATFFITPMLILILRPDLPKRSSRTSKTYESASSLIDELQ
jgi:predicted RND superfamily exporter protein